MDIQVPPWMVDDEDYSSVFRQVRRKEGSIGPYSDVGLQNQKQCPVHPKVVQIEGFSQGDFTAPHVCSLGTVSIVSPTSEHNTSLWDTVLGRKNFLMSLFSQKAN